MISKTQLIERIKDAFENEVLGNGIGLSEADAIDNYADEKLRAEARAKDEKLNWSDIPASELNKYNSSLSFFDAKGMAFHLPAFMIAELEGEYRFDITSVLINISSYKKLQFALLTREQRQVIKLFLEYMQEYQEIDRSEIATAIEQHWSK